MLGYVQGSMPLSVRTDQGPVALATWLDQWADLRDAEGATLVGTRARRYATQCRALAASMPVAREEWAQLQREVSRFLAERRASMVDGLPPGDDDR
jgi:hypothetical protein